MGVATMLAALVVPVPSSDASLWFDGAHRWGFVWADRPTHAAYTPSTAYQGNSTGATNTITRQGPGRYTVRFRGLGTALDGNVQVTAYGGGSDRCKVVNWYPWAGDQLVRVRCHTRTGTPADSRFTANFHAGVGRGGNFAGYVWASNPTAPLDVWYTPPTPYQENTTGARNRVMRFGTGLYEVDFTQGPRTGGHVQVTAYGDDGNYCMNTYGSGHFDPDTGRALVTVQCQDPNGNRVDAAFTALLTTHRTPVRGHGAYLWAEWNQRNDWYEPRTDSSWSSTGGAIRARRTGPGAYQVRLANMPASHATTVTVSSKWWVTNQCKVRSWYPSGRDTIVLVDCYDTAGRPANNQFLLLYQSNRS